MASRPDDDPPAPAASERPAAPAGPEGEDRPSRPPRTPRVGGFHVRHRGGTRVEIAEPVHVGGERPWMCAVKLVGRAADQRAEQGDPAEGEPTQTLLLRMGRGASPEDARRDGLAQLTLVYGSPVEPPPRAVIHQKKSDPPPPLDPAEGAGLGAGDAVDSGWLERIARRIKR